MLVSGRLPAFLVALTTGLLLFAFLFTQDYPVSTVNVEGLSLGDARDVVQTSGLLGEPAFRADLDDAARAIAALPYVERVEVTLAFPGEATIVVTEREPVLIVAQGANRSVVAASGRVIAPSTEKRDLPVLNIPPGTPAIDDGLPDDLVAAILMIVESRGVDVELRWTSDDGIVVSLPTQQEVIFGGPELLVSKLTVLAAVEEQIDADWDILDLREPTRPAYR